MSSLGLPVPPGFTITTEACVHYYANEKQYPAELKEQVVAGLAALVRSRVPTRTAHQVSRRITATAHNPARGNDNLVGAGVVDPVAALTYAVSPGDPLPKDAWGKPVAAPMIAPPPDRRPMYTALIGLGVCVLVVGGIVGMSKLRRAQR